MQIHDSGFTHMGLSGGSAVKNLSIMQEVQETRVQSLGHKDPLEEEMATHSSILAWRIPWAEKHGGLQEPGVTKNWTRLRTEYTHTEMPEPQLSLFL